MSFFRDPFTGPIFFFSHVTHPFLIKVKADPGQDTDLEYPKPYFPVVPHFLSHSIMKKLRQDSCPTAPCASVSGSRTDVAWGLHVAFFFLVGPWSTGGVKAPSDAFARTLAWPRVFNSFRTGSLGNINVYTPLVKFGSSFQSWIPAILPDHRIL